MRKNSINIALTAAITAIYAVLTLSLGFISYGPIQFRVAEIMMLLAFLDKGYIVGLTLGCFLANVIGPYGVPDIIFGTLATFISASMIYITRKLGKQNKSTLVIASLYFNCYKFDCGWSNVKCILWASINSIYDTGRFWRICSSNNCRSTIFLLFNEKI